MKTIFNEFKKNRHHYIKLYSNADWNIFQVTEISTNEYWFEVFKKRFNKGVEIYPFNDVIFESSFNNAKLLIEKG